MNRFAWNAQSVRTVPISDSTAGCPDFQRKQPRISPEGRVHRKSHSIFCHWSSDHQDYLISFVMAHHTSVTNPPPHHSTTKKLRAIKVRQWVGLKSSGCSHWAVTIECRYFYATKNVPSPVPLWHFEDRWPSHTLFTHWTWTWTHFLSDVWIYNYKYCL